MFCLDERPAGHAHGKPNHEPTAKGHFETTYGTKCKWRQIVEDRWLSVDDIKEYLDIKCDTAYKWISGKHMPAHKVGRLWKFRKEDIDEWMRSGGGQSDAKDKPVDEPQ